MDSSIGLYVHVPFCVSRCDYCAFATWAGSEGAIGDYIEAVLAELRLRRQVGDPFSVQTLYFGGGTPSLVPARDIARIIEEIGPEPGAEITIECNPESVTRDKLKAYKGAGVNRVSLGLQSFSGEVLRSLGRSHDPKDIYPAVEAIDGAGIENYSVDLIYGAANESLAALEETVQKVLELSPVPMHVSAYALTVEKNTPLARDLARYPNEDYQAVAYTLIDEMLTGQGMGWYEISNWSRPGYFSRHNWNYWMQGEYLGLGCSAHSHLGSRRTWNIFNFNRYILVAGNSGDPTAGSEEVSGHEKATEALELLLRTNVGIPATAIDRFDEVASLCDLVDGVATLNLKGRLLANQVALRLDPSRVGLEELKWFQKQTPEMISS